MAKHIFENLQGGKRFWPGRAASSLKHWSGPVYFAAVLFYFEQVFHITVYKELYWNISILLIFPAAALCGLFVSSPNTKVNRALAAVLTGLFAVAYGAQLIYYRVFSTFLVLRSVGEGGVGQAWQFRSVVFDTILKNALPVFLLLLPVVGCILLRRKLGFLGLRWIPAGILLAAAVLLHAAALLVLPLGGTALYSPYDLYHNTLSPELSMRELGVFTTMRLDVKYLIFGEPETADFILPEPSAPATSEPAPSPNSSSQPEITSTPVPIDTSPNVLDLDFDTLIAESSGVIQKMHEYFSQVQPTLKNEYTGMFEGYNVIFLCAEGFSHLAIDPELTPTLYKMSTEGFVFKNFYNPIWGVSTSDGEYVNLTGLIPKSGVWSMKTTGTQKNDMYFTLGRQFERLGYPVRGYHNHTYKFYGRQLSHPNMGFVWKALGNGLDVKETWPESDLEMMEKTVPEYIDDEHFFTYYMTVSGHLWYSFNGNAMAYKNRDVVADLPYSETARAYLACNYELEKALSYLVERLEEKGIADKTLIVLSADHYPYGLVDGDDYSAYSELLGHEVEKNFELYRNAFLIWSPSMEKPVVVDKYCSTLDVLPTVSNLLGLKYDSRLLMGVDLLSDSDPLVIFNNRSWISQKCMYNSRNMEVIPLTEEEVTQEYVDTMNYIVSNKTNLSASILENDYYKYIHQALAPPETE